MGIASEIFTWLKSAPEDGMDTDGVKIICGDDAASGDLSAVADAEGCAGDFGDDERVDERTTFLQVEQFGPGNIVGTDFAARGSGEGSQLFLVRYQRVGTEEDAFDPTEDRGVGADSKGEAKDGQGGKARATTEHAKADAEILPYRVEAQRKPNGAGVFAGDSGCAHAAVGGIAVAGFLLEHLAVEVHFFGKLLGLTTLAEEMEDAANQAHDITFWMARIIRANSLFSAASCLRPAAVSL